MHSAVELVASDVDKRYTAPAGEREVVRGCSFSIPAGKLTVMIGPSGCGKSTLIRLLAGFERPTAGRITFDGVEITEPSPDRLVLFQESALFPWMTTYDNLLYGPRARGPVSAQSLELAEALLDQVGLRAFRDKYPSQLSGGMQRRAELARALINEPKLMILDEPFRGLDAMTKELMWEYYARLFEKSARTHFFVTTDIDEAVFLADRILVMSNIPTRVCAVLDVNLPRPRSLQGVQASEHAGEIKARALSILHDEALKSFGSLERKARVGHG